MTLHEYALRVKEVREAQKTFFRLTRTSTARPSERTAALEHSKKLERELDEITAAILSPAPMPELFTAPEK